MTERCARVVDAISTDPVTGAEWPVSRPLAMKLLQREHAAVVRKVKDDKKKAERVKALSRKSYQEGVWLAEGQRQYCVELLAWLDERGR